MTENKEIKFFKHMNNLVKQKPEILTVDDLNNFKYNFSQLNSKTNSVYRMYLDAGKKTLKNPTEVNSNLRKKQTYKEFIETIHKLTIGSGHNPESNLSNDELLEIMKYILRNSDYTYYDLWQ